MKVELGAEVTKSLLTNINDIPFRQIKSTTLVSEYSDGKYGRPEKTGLVMTINDEPFGLDLATLTSIALHKPLKVPADDKSHEFYDAFKIESELMLNRTYDEFDDARNYFNKYYKHVNFLVIIDTKDVKNKIIYVNVQAGKDFSNDEYFNKYLSYLENMLIDKEEAESNAEVELMRKLLSGDPEDRKAFMNEITKGIDKYCR